MSHPESYLSRLDPDAILTGEETADLLGCSVQTLARERRENRGIPYVKFNRNRIGYRRRDVLAHIQAHMVEVER